jgi:hypothetical protein
LFSYINSPARACPWYTITPAANYTNLTSAVAICASAGCPIYACNNATIGAAETFMFTTNIAIVGAPAGASGAPIITCLTAALTPVFTLISGAEVSFANLQIAFNNSLFLVQGSSTLLLNQVDMWLGNVAVTVQTPNSPGSGSTLGTGLIGEFVGFFSVGIAIYQLTGPVQCTACIYDSPRICAIATINAALISTSAGAGAPLTYSTWINTPNYVSILTTLSSTPIPVQLPALWGRINHNILVITYQPNCVVITPSFTPRAAAGSGAGATPSPAPKPNKDTGTDGWMIALVVIAALLLVTVATISVASRRTQNTSNPNLAAQGYVHVNKE